MGPHDGQPLHWVCYDSQLYIAGAHPNVLPVPESNRRGQQSGIGLGSLTNFFAGNTESIECTFAVLFA